MKKLLLVMLVAGFVACNNSSETEGENKDTTATQAEPMAQPAPDTTATVTPPVDTVAVAK